jgi:hypothetical protein
MIIFYMIQIYYLRGKKDLLSYKDYKSSNIEIIEIKNGAMKNL